MYIRDKTNNADTHRGPMPWLLIAFAVFAIIAITIDDGNTWKTIGTIGLISGLAGMIQLRRTRNARFRLLLVVGFAILAASIVIRIGLHQGWW